MKPDPMRKELHRLTKILRELEFLGWNARGDIVRIAMPAFIKKWNRRAGRGRG